jgi:hypothetical protein
MNWLKNRLFVVTLLAGMGAVALPSLSYAQNLPTPEEVDELFGDPYDLNLPGEAGEPPIKRSGQPRAQEPRRNIPERREEPRQENTHPTQDDTPSQQDLTTRVNAFWNAFSEASNTSSGKQEALRGAMSYLNPAIYTQTRSEMFELIAFPGNNLPSWNEFLDDYFSRRPVDLQISGIGESTVLVSGTMNKITKFALESLRGKLLTYKENFPDIPENEMEKMIKETKENLHKYCESFNSSTIEEYAIVSIPISLEGGNLDDIKEELKEQMKMLVDPDTIFDANTCRFGQLWVKVDNEWYVHTNTHFYDKLNRFVGMDAEQTHDIIQATGMSGALFRAFYTGELSQRGNSLQYETDNIGTVFSISGFYEGESFIGEYRDAANRTRMKITPSMQPGNGIAEGYIAELVIDGEPTLFIFVDEDWKDQIPDTKIYFGRSFENEIEFDFENPTEKKNGVYMMRVLDDPKRFENNFSTHFGGVYLGDLREDNRSTLIVFR